MEQSREQARTTWLTQIGWQNYTLEPASADASFRSYWRVQGTYKGQQQCRILMNAPPQQEDSRPFIAIAQMLRGAGMHSPEIFAQDLQLGFLLLEDLGNTTFADLDTSTRETHYAQAVETIIRAQSISAAQLPTYDETLLRTEMELFSEWLLRRHLQLNFDRSQSAQWERTMRLLCANALEQPQTFVHRDYHSRNLMVTEKNNPGVIDFQDAVRGPICYDLVSLLRDCYWQCPSDLLDKLFNQFIQSAQCQSLTVDASLWRRWFDLMGVQRHLKASGIFCRLNYRDGKSGYLADVPLTLSYISEVADRYVELAWLGEYLAHHVLPRLADHSS